MGYNEEDISITRRAGTAVMAAVQLCEKDDD